MRVRGAKASIASRLHWQAQAAGDERRFSRRCRTRRRGSLTFGGNCAKVKTTCSPLTMLLSPPKRRSSLSSSATRSPLRMGRARSRFPARTNVSKLHSRKLPPAPVRVGEIARANAVILLGAALDGHRMVPSLASIAALPSARGHITPCLRWLRNRRGALRDLDPDGRCTHCVDEDQKERSDDGAASISGLAMGRVGSRGFIAAEFEPPRWRGVDWRCARADGMGRSGVDRPRAMAVCVGTFAGAGSRIGVRAHDAGEFRALDAGGGDRRAGLYAVVAEGARIRAAKSGLRLRLSRARLCEWNRLPARARPVGERAAGQPLSRALPSGPSVVRHAGAHGRCIRASAARTFAFVDALAFRWSREQRRKARRRDGWRSTVSGVDAGAGRCRRVIAAKLSSTHVRDRPPLAYRGCGVVLLHARHAVHRASCSQRQLARIALPLRLAVAVRGLGPDWRNGGHP